MNAIEIKNLRKEYGKTVAVENLSLCVPAGSFFGFLGPNGAGKSTTIGCLTGLLDPTAGSIQLFGQPFNSDPVSLKKRIGIMPENLALFEALYAHEFLSFQARMYGLDSTTARTRVRELLEAMGLNGTRKQPISEFSAGMRKRLAFAAAIISNPEILFLDEPFESIDPAGVAIIKQWLQRLITQGRTVFLTSHVLENVERLCDRAAIIKKPGNLIWQGDISPLASNRPIFENGQEFRSLEDLFLHATGERYTAPLDWL
ncbi:MAG: ABC transporter ATP-binding protein [Acidobacteriota bacterium]